MGNGEWRMGNGEWGMANGEWRMGIEEWQEPSLEFESSFKVPLVPRTCSIKYG